MANEAPEMADVPAPPRVLSKSTKVIIVTIAGIITALPVLIPFGMCAIMAYDRVTGKTSHMERASTVLSPNGKTRFTADINGVLTLTDVQTGRTLQTKRLETREYRIVEAKWLDNRHVDIFAKYRYPMLRNGDYITWTGPKWDDGPFSDSKF